MANLLNDRDAGKLCRLMFRIRDNYEAFGVVWVCFVMSVNSLWLVENSILLSGGKGILKSQSRAGLVEPDS